MTNPGFTIYPSLSRICVEAASALVARNLDIAFKLTATAQSLASLLTDDAQYLPYASQRLELLERQIETVAALADGERSPLNPSRSGRFTQVLSHFLADQRSTEPNPLRGSLPWRCTGMNRHLPQILGVSKLVAPFGSESDGAAVDFLCTWGVTKAENHNIARQVAYSSIKPLLSLEYGFVSSTDIALKESPQHSLILSPGAMYYDASHVTYIEARLNNPRHVLSEEQRQRARRSINLILEREVTKYNHAPSMDLSLQGFDPRKKRILLVDQRYGDNSIAMGLASQDTFHEMLNCALAHEDHEILVKIHPDALTGGKHSSLSALLKNTDQRRIQIIDFDVNPYSLFKIVSKVFVCVSQLGLEALLAGKEVHCFGVPFYAGWGLTIDHQAPPRPRRRRSLEDLFHMCYLESCVYGLASGPCELAELIEYIDRNRGQKGNIAHSGEAVVISPFTYAPVAEAMTGAAQHGDERFMGRIFNSAMASTAGEASAELRLVFVLPSGRFGASGRYFQDLAYFMQKRGARIMVLAEGSPKPNYGNVAWRGLRFKGMLLEPALMQEIADFKPQFIYENGVRSRSQRAALEILVRTGARLVMQSEDDDVQVYRIRHPHPDPSLLKILDCPTPSTEKIAEFLTRNDWMHTISTWAEPSHDRWVEPVLRSICYHAAVAHTAIWYPFAERLRKEFGKPTIVVPPVADMKRITSGPDPGNSRQSTCAEIGAAPDSLILFLGGTVYDYSDEFLNFLHAIALAAKKTTRALTLVVVSGRTNLKLDSLAKKALPAQVAYINLGDPDDSLYDRILRACDVVCAPGMADDFNRYRLPSRLVKAMAAGKAIFTFGIGFGESLRHGENAFLTASDDPDEWADVLIQCTDDARREIMGRNAVAFAMANFDAGTVAQNLFRFFSELREDILVPGDRIALSKTDLSV